MDENKILVEPKEGEPTWLTYIKTVINWTPIVLFFGVMYFIANMIIENPAIQGRVNSYLGLVGVSSMLGILTLIAGSSLIIKCNPWINFKELMKGDGQSKLAGSIMFASIILALAFIVIASN